MGTPRNGMFYILQHFTKHSETRIEGIDFRWEILKLPKNKNHKDY